MASGLEEMIISLQTFETAFGFGLPGKRKILADFNEGSPSWPWAGAHRIWDRLRELDLVEVEKEKFMGDLIAAYNQLNRRCRGNKAKFFLQMQERKVLQDKREPVQCSTTETPDRHYGEKLQWGWWNTRIGFLLRNIQKLLDRTLSNLKQLALLGAGGWARCLSGAPTHIVLLLP